jgi:cation transport regulator ChaC
MLARAKDEWGGRGDLWVFAYASLIWRPDFDPSEQRLARVHGWHRALKMWSRVNRGTPECPGLVFALLPGGSCQGAVLRVPQRDGEAVLHQLWDREMMTGVYDPKWLPCQTPGGTGQGAGFHTVAQEPELHRRPARAALPRDLRRRGRPLRQHAGLCTPDAAMPAGPRHPRPRAAPPAAPCPRAGPLNRDPCDLLVATLPFLYSSMNNIADLRKSYERAELSEDASHADPLQQFGQWLDEAIASEVPEPNAMTLATVGSDLRPSTRVVLIKGYDARGIVWYTNYESRKGQELAGNPYAALQFHWVELERVVRIEGVVEKVERRESDAYFHSRPLDSRIGAWASARSHR